uniref:N-alpha-acetyltransferase 16, NatA auxiliary subunit-like n=1 Tax=Diabrotica virgifera virgifera TaxID=50390 RepID=A0A6P7GYM4_DIAVI
VDDPLEQAIKFLQPLQTLAKDRIETHLMAFEVYYRKQKSLLMLQSLKRAYKVDPKNPKLHSCLIRFYQFVQKNKTSWDPNVDQVITQETKVYLEGKDAVSLNKEFLEKNSNSLGAVLEGAKVMYELDKKRQNEAISLATSLDNKYDDVNIEVCTDILKSLTNGDFGGCDAQLEEYTKRCNVRFPYTAVFKPPSSEPDLHIESANHVQEH